MQSASLLSKSFAVRMDWCEKFVVHQFNISKKLSNTKLGGVKVFWCKNSLMHSACLV